jgi:hypothetical protein
MYSLHLDCFWVWSFSCRVVGARLVERIYRGDRGVVKCIPYWKISYSGSLRVGRICIRAPSEGIRNETGRNLGDMFCMQETFHRDWGSDTSGAVIFFDSFCR